MRVYRYKCGAADRDRTGTTVARREILSLLRLPILPPGGAVDNFLTIEQGKVGKNWVMTGTHPKRGQPHIFFYFLRFKGGFKSAPGKTRTCDLLIRSQALYPTELRARLRSWAIMSKKGAGRNR